MFVIIKGYVNNCMIIRFGYTIFLPCLAFDRFVLWMNGWFHGADAKLVPPIQTGDCLVEMTRVKKKLHKLNLKRNGRQNLLAIKNVQVN